MQQAEILPQQSLQTIANWGITFSARPTEERELVQLYGKPLYRGAIAFSKWWRELNIGQIQILNQIDFPYWTLSLASKLAKVPLPKLDSCLEALQNAQLGVSKLSQIVNKFIPKAKLGFGRIITESDWSLIASTFELDRKNLDSIQQQALRTNGSSTQSMTTDDVIEILREGGYQIEQILPKPKIKRYSFPEVEQLIGLKVQEALQAREEHLLAAIERSRYLETENERLMNQLRSPSQCPTTVEITPVTEEELEQPDVFEECLGLWEMSLSVGDRVLVIDKGDNDYYGQIGEIIDRDKNNLSVWWVQFSDGDCQQFCMSAIEILRREIESTSIPRPMRAIQKFKEIEQVPMAG